MTPVYPHPVMSAFGDDDKSEGTEALRQSLELGLLVGGARREGLVVAAEGPLDIFLEIAVEDREGAGEPGEILLRDEQHDGILERHHETGPKRGAEQHALTEMVAGPEQLFEVLLGLGVIDGEFEGAFDHGVEAVDDHARLEHTVALAVVDVARPRGGRLDLHDVRRHHAVDEPVEADPKFWLKTGQEREIEATPEQPGQRARQLDTVDVGDRLAHAERSERTLRGIGEGLELLAVELGKDVRG